MRSPVRDGRPLEQIASVPGGTQTQIATSKPSTEVLGYFRVSLPGQKQKPLVNGASVFDQPSAIVRNDNQAIAKFPELSAVYVVQRGNVRESS